MRPLRYAWRVPLLLLHVVLGILLCSLVLTWRRDVVMKNGREPFAHRTIRWWSTALLRIFGLRSVRVGQPLADAHRAQAEDAQQGGGPPADGAMRNGSRPFCITTSRRQVSTSEHSRMPSTTCSSSNGTRQR